MTIQNLQAEWTKSFQEAMTSVERSITSSPTDDKDLAGFKALSKWLMETPHNPYNFMPRGYEGYRSSPYAADSVLGLLHHALIDDGEVSFVKMMRQGEVVRVFMNFYWQHEDNFKELCMEENKSLIENMMSTAESSERLREFMEKNHPGKVVLPEKHFSKDFEFVAHRNPVQFIKEVDDFQVAQDLKYKAMDENIRAWQNKM